MVIGTEGKNFADGSLGVRVSGVTGMSYHLISVPVNPGYRRNSTIYLDADSKHIQSSITFLHTQSILPPG